VAKNINEVPFTELVERAGQLARITNENERSRVRGAVNDEWRDLPNKEDWSFLKSSSSIACIPPLSTGQATVTTQSNTVTFSADVALDSAYTGRKIKFSNNDNVYVDYDVIC